MKILLVCTANQCRSPMAEILLRRDLEDRGVSAETRSCGLLGAGEPAAEVAAEAMRRFGLDLDSHRSRRLDSQLVVDSDLVLAMEREHLRAVVVMVPTAFGRTFTLKELVRLAQAAPPRFPGEDLGAYLTRIGAERRPRDLLGHAAEDDVADPMGLGLDACEDTAAQLDQLCQAVTELLVPP